MKLWRVLGIISFYLSWPLIALYLRNTERTRVVVTSGDKILVVKGWLGDGKWSLPGGGIQNGEPIIQGALRELKEETGIELGDNSLTALLSENFRLHGTNTRLHYLSAVVPNLLPVERQRGEIVSVEWVQETELNDNNTGKDALRAIAVWKTH